jgi:hypothetical protein
VTACVVTTSAGRPAVLPTDLDNDHTDCSRCEYTCGPRGRWAFVVTGQVVCPWCVTPGELERVEEPDQPEAVTPCVVRGQHATACVDAECTGCLPTPAAPGSRACGWHHDGTRDMLTGSSRERVVPSLADLYEALAEAPVGARGPGDGEAAQVIGDERRQARSAIKAMLVSWCLLLAEPAENGGRGLSVPDERVIAARTNWAIVAACADGAVALQAWRDAAMRGEHPPFDAIRRQRARVARLREQRLSGADVIAALADHIDRHLAWLLASEHAGQLVHDVASAWRWSWALAGGGRRLPAIRCSCGGQVPMALAEDAGERAVQVFTCPACGEWGVLDWWRAREGFNEKPMPLVDLVPWLAEHHRVTVTEKQLRNWADRGDITPTAGGGAPGVTRLFDPVAVAMVADGRRRTA